MLPSAQTSAPPPVTPLRASTDTRLFSVEQMCSPKASQAEPGGRVNYEDEDLYNSTPRPARQDNTIRFTSPSEPAIASCSGINTAPTRPFSSLNDELSLIRTPPPVPATVDGGVKGNYCESSHAVDDQRTLGTRGQSPWEESINLIDSSGGSLQSLGLDADGGSDMSQPFADRSQDIQGKTLQHELSRQTSPLDEAPNCQQSSSPTPSGALSTGRRTNDQEAGEASLSRSESSTTSPCRDEFSGQASSLDQPTNCQQSTSIASSGALNSGRMTNEHEAGETSPSRFERSTTSPCPEYEPGDQQTARASRSQPNYLGPGLNFENAANHQQLVCKTISHSEPTPAFRTGPATNDNQAAYDAPLTIVPLGSCAPSPALNLAGSVRTSQLEHLNAEQEVPALGSSFMNDNSAAVTTKGIASQGQVLEIAKSETESAQEYRHTNRRREKAPMPRSDPLQFRIIEDLQPHLDEPEADRPDDFDRGVAEARRKDTHRPGNRPDDAPLVDSPSPGRLYTEKEVMARVAAARLERGSVERTLDSSRAEKRKRSISVEDRGTPRPSNRCLKVARLKSGSIDLGDSKIEGLVRQSRRLPERMSTPCRALEAPQSGSSTVANLHFSTQIASQRELTMPASIPSCIRDTRPQVESSSTTDEHRQPDAVPQAAACFEDEDDEEDIKLKLEESQLKQEQNQLKQKLRKMEKARLRVERASGAVRLS